jgi:hypothetical protein
MSNTFTSLWSDNKPVPKNKFDFSAATASLLDKPCANTTGIPSN